MLQEYDALVQHLEDNIFHSNQQTDTDQLDRIGKKLLGSGFAGSFPEDKKIKFNGKRCYYIFNTDKSNQKGCHWTGIYIDHKNKKLYAFDSFDRQISKLLKDVVIDAKKNHFTVKQGTHVIEQQDNQNDCGQRSLAWLLMVKKHGIDDVIKGFK